MTNYLRNIFETVINKNLIEKINQVITNNKIISIEYSRITIYLTTSLSLRFRTNINIILVNKVYFKHEFSTDIDSRNISISF